MNKEDFIKFIESVDFDKVDIFRIRLRKENEKITISNEDMRM